MLRASDLYAPNDAPLATVAYALGNLGLFSLLSGGPRVQPHEDQHLLLIHEIDFQQVFILI